MRYVYVMLFNWIAEKMVGFVMFNLELNSRHVGFSGSLFYVSYLELYLREMS
jgi:hypothetical protein